MGYFSDLDLCLKIIGQSKYSGRCTCGYKRTVIALNGINKITVCNNKLCKEYGKEK